MCPLWPGESQLTPCPPAPPTHLHISIPFAPNLFPSVSPSFYTHVHSPATFLHSYSPPFLFHTSPIPLPPISLFLVFSMAVPLLSAPYPTLKYSLALFSHVPLTLPGPSHPPAPPTLHFAFLILSMATPMLPAPSPTLIYSPELFSHVPIPLPGPSHTPALPTSPPYPPFRLFGPFMDAFLSTFISYSIYMCTYMIYSIE